MQAGGEGAANLPPPSVCSVRKHLQDLCQETPVFASICQEELVLKLWYSWGTRQKWGWEQSGKGKIQTGKTVSNIQREQVKTGDSPQDCCPLLFAETCYFCPIGLTQVDHDRSQLIHRPGSDLDQCSQIPTDSSTHVLWSHPDCSHERSFSN